MLVYAGLMVLLLSWVHPSKTAKTADITFTNTSCSGDHVRSVFQAVALCEPRKKVIKLPLPSNSSILQMSPRYITVSRCGGGGCHESRKICVPTSSHMKTVPVLLGRCGITAGKCDKECASVQVKEDLQCGCECAIKKEHCNTLQDYREDLCSCECRDKKLVRSCEESGRRWDPSTCTCKCPVNSDRDCSTGLVFDEENTCTCVPEIGGKNDVPLERTERSHQGEFFLRWEIIIIIVLIIIIFLFIVVTISLMRDLFRLRKKLSQLISNTYQLYNHNNPSINGNQNPSQNDLQVAANRQDSLLQNGSLSLGGYPDNSNQYGGYKKIHPYPVDEYVDSVSQYSGHRTITPYSDTGYESYASRPNHNANRRSESFASRPNYNTYRSMPQYPTSNDYLSSMNQYGGLKIDFQYPQNDQMNFINMKHQENLGSHFVQQGRYRSVPFNSGQGMTRPSQGGRITPATGYAPDSGVESEATRSLLSESIVDEHYNPTTSSTKRPLVAPKPRFYNQSMEPHVGELHQPMTGRPKLYGAKNYNLGEKEIENVDGNNEGKDIDMDKYTEEIGSYEDDDTKEAITSNIGHIPTLPIADQPFHLQAKEQRNFELCNPVKASCTEI